MKAVLLQQGATEISIVERERPRVRADAVLVKMLAAPVLSYMQRVVDRSLPYLLPSSSFIPGSDAIGIVEEVGSEVFGLKPGCLVHARPQIASRGWKKHPDDILIGLTGMSPESAAVQDIWKDGSFAEYLHYPVDCVTPLDLEGLYPPEKLGALMFLSVGYGGLQAAELHPGESVIIGGGSGNFGSFSVLVALALGASRVIPVGRNADVLNSLKALDPKRVFPVVLTGSAEEDPTAIQAAAGGHADCFLDITGGGGTDPVLSCLRALRPQGRAVLMGALHDPIQIPYVELMHRGLRISGNFMYPPESPARLAELLRSGLLSLDACSVSNYPLDDAAEALRHASNAKGLQMVSLRGADA